jgi:hypothetical protein
MVVRLGVTLMRRCSDGLCRGRMQPRSRGAEGKNRHGDSDQDGQRSAGNGQWQTSKRQA